MKVRLESVICRVLSLLKNSRSHRARAASPYIVILVERSRFSGTPQAIAVGLNRVFQLHPAIKSKLLLLYYRKLEVVVKSQNVSVPEDTAAVEIVARHEKQPLIPLISATSIQ
jgi:hypothetical protein